jgi:hypothetical protein
MTYDRGNIATYSLIIVTILLYAVILYDNADAQVSSNTLESIASKPLNP